MKLFTTNSIVKTDTTLNNLVSIDDDDDDDDDDNNNNNNNGVLCDVAHDVTKAFFTFTVSYSLTGYV